MDDTAEDKVPGSHSPARIAEEPTRPAHPLAETSVAARLCAHAASCAENPPELSALAPRAFADQVINGTGVAVDSGDWVQPLYRRTDGEWKLGKLEVLYRLSDARHVPFPAFVDFIKASSDEVGEPDPELRRIFCAACVESMQRVDACLSQLGAEQRASMARMGLLTALNFTAKQLSAALAVPLQNRKLLAIEETEYDDAPEDLSQLRQQAWQSFGALSLDDVKPTLADVEARARGRVDVPAPAAPDGAPFKPLASYYRHDFVYARRFIADYARARRADPEARAELKLDEEFCCYLIGVGHAPFSREVMQAWRKAYPEAGSAVREAGLELLREALQTGMSICLEVNFHDADVQWLHAELPELDGRLLKQGGLSGSTALPFSLMSDLLNFGI